MGPHIQCALIHVTYREKNHFFTFVKLIVSLSICYCLKRIIKAYMHNHKNIYTLDHHDHHI